MVGMDWDERERLRKKYFWEVEEGRKLIKKYIPLMLEYLKQNGIEIPRKDSDQFWEVFYDHYYILVRDAKFIDFAYDKSGIIFNRKMFGIDDKVLEEFIEMDKKRNPELYERFYRAQEE